MKKNKVFRYLVIIMVVLVLFAIIGKKAGWIGQGVSTEVITEKVAKRTIIETVSASGKIQPEVEVKISPDVSGQIIELRVKEGDQVKKGDLLCKINPDLYLSNLDKMAAAVNTSKANLANSRARLTQIKAQFVNSEASYNRNKKLFEEKAISQAEYDASKAAYESAKADVEAAEQTVNASEYNVKNAEASLTEANDNLRRTSIYAPVDGKVSKLNVENGERVVGTSQMAGTEIMRIANLNEMEVNVDVNENDIVRIRLHDTAEIEVDAYLDRKFFGVVTEIANSANTTGVSAADQVTNFPVKIRILRESYQDLIPAIEPNYSPFRPGMSATVDIRTNTVYKALSVPIPAVTTRIDSTKLKVDDDKPEDETKEVREKYQKPEEIVFLVKDGKVHKRKVITGIQDNNYIQILSGIADGDEIVSGPYSAVSRLLKDSSKVEVIDKDELYRRRKDMKE
jgi:HlyD family secretion protein